MRKLPAKSRKVHWIGMLDGGEESIGKTAAYPQQEKTIVILSAFPVPGLPFGMSASTVTIAHASPPALA